MVRVTTAGGCSIKGSCCQSTLAAVAPSWARICACRPVAASSRPAHSGKSASQFSYSKPPPPGLRRRRSHHRHRATKRDIDTGHMPIISAAQLTRHPGSVTRDRRGTARVRAAASPRGEDLPGPGGIAAAAGDLRWEHAVRDQIVGFAVTRGAARPGPRLAALVWLSRPSRQRSPGRRHPPEPARPRCRHLAAGAARPEDQRGFPP